MKDNFIESYRFYSRLDIENDFPPLPFPICIVPIGKFLKRIML
jgi:hypothetical protein